jgi:hypothetical protein
MLFSWMRSREVFVKIDVSEECVSPILKVERISELGTALAVTSLISFHRLLFSESRR